MITYLLLLQAEQTAGAAGLRPRTHHLLSGVHQEDAGLRRCCRSCSKLRLFIKAFILWLPVVSAHPPGHSPEAWQKARPTLAALLTTYNTEQRIVYTHSNSR